MRLPVLICSLVAAASPAFGSNICAGGQRAHSTENDTDAPIHEHARNITVVIRHGGNTDLQQGFNPLDKPTTIACRSASGCLITAEWRIAASGGTQWPCSYIDDVAMAPNQNSSLGVFWGKTPVGQHTIQSKIDELEATGSFYAWEITYTIYDK